MSQSLAQGSVPRRALVIGAVAALVGAGALSGCSKSDNANLSGERMVASSSAKDKLVRAKEAAAQVQNVHITGMVVSGKSSMGLDLRVAGWSAGGTAEIDGGQAEVRIVNGSLYLKGDQVFWDALKKGAGDQFGDSWVQASTASGPQFVTLLDLVPLKTALDRLAPTPAAWTQVDGRKLDGVDTIGLRNLASGKGGGDTLYLPRTGSARPAGIEFGKGGLLIFSDWGTKVTAPVVPPQPILDATGAKLVG